MRPSPTLWGYAYHPWQIQVSAEWMKASEFVLRLGKPRHLLQSKKEGPGAQCAPEHKALPHPCQGPACLGLVLVATPPVPPIATAQETRPEKDAVVRTNYLPFPQPPGQILLLLNTHHYLTTQVIH